MASKLSLLRRLTLSVLLPFALLLTQQGALLHELTHWHAATDSVVQTAEAPSADHDLCVTCLAFAQVAGLAKFDVAALPAPAGLRYHFAAVAWRDVADATLPVARSRGPPSGR